MKVVREKKLRDTTQITARSFSLNKSNVSFYGNSLIFILAMPHCKWHFSAIAQVRIIVMQMLMKDKVQF